MNRYHQQSNYQHFQESKELEDDIVIDDSLLLDLLAYDNFLIENEENRTNCGDNNNITNCNTIIQVPHSQDHMIVHTNDILIDTSIHTSTSSGTDNNQLNMETRYIHISLRKL